MTTDMTPMDPIAAAEAVLTRVSWHSPSGEKDLANALAAMIAEVERLTAPLDGDEAKAMPARLRAMTVIDTFGGLQKIPDCQEAADYIERQAARIESLIQQLSQAENTELRQANEELKAQLAALTALPEDLEWLAWWLIEWAEGRTQAVALDKVAAQRVRRAAQALRAQHAELARRDRVDADVRADINRLARFYYGDRSEGLKEALAILDAKPAERTDAESERRAALAGQRAEGE